MPAATTHPTADALEAFAVGRLPDDQLAQVEAHVADCDACCRQLAVGNRDSLLDLARQAMMATPDIESGPALDTPPDTPAGLIDHPKYRILGRLGAGGMGVVYKAEHRMMGRTVALKVLTARTVAKAGAVERFRREVRLAGRLSHPNIVTAHDADEAGGQHFLVMEYVEGVSLDRLVAKKGPLPVPQACHFARQAALGLQHAADKGMVHRDVKPQNLMVTRKGQVKVLDFGLACVARGDGEPAGTGTAAQVTNPDFVLGTPDFLAPEQARSSAAVDARADLYGLGCTLFYLLTGRPPFGGTTAFEKLIAHTTEEAPSVSAARPDVPAGLAELVRKLMAKNPADRFQTPAEVAAALLPFTREGVTATPPPVLVAVPVAAPVAAGDTLTDPLAAMTTGVDERPRKRRKKPAPTFVERHRGPLVGGALGLVLLAVAVVGLWQFGGPPTTPTGGPPPVVEGKPKPDERPPAVAPQPQPAAGLSVLIVLPQSDLYYPDYGPVREAFERAKVTVTTAATTRGPCYRHKLTPGEPVTPDLALRDVDPTRFDGLVFVGAGVGDYIPGGAAVLDVRRLIDGMRGRRPVGAICIGMRVLGDLGYLRGKAARSQFYTPPRNVVTEPGVVTQAPFVTAGTYEDGEAFAAEMVRLMTKQATGK